ncbi:MAG: hypothetical protein MZV63_06145 [Marinilabiliales bacterium]|nr:hypothetical protein [Marinilabiliales bacterium]
MPSSPPRAEMKLELLGHFGTGRVHRGGDAAAAAAARARGRGRPAAAVLDATRGSDRLLHSVRALRRAGRAGDESGGRRRQRRRPGAGLRVAHAGSPGPLGPAAGLRRPACWPSTGWGRRSATSPGGPAGTRGRRRTDRRRARRRHGGPVPAGGRRAADARRAGGVGGPLGARLVPGRRAWPSPRPARTAACCGTWERRNW